MNEIMKDRQVFLTNTPIDIMAMSEADVVEKAKSLCEAEYSVPLKIKQMVIKRMYELYGFHMSNDLLLALLVDARQQLILAPAGGCKTTSSQIKLILLKIFWKKLYKRDLTSSECLCLVYNAENRPQMDRKHLELLSPLVMSGFISHNQENPSYINSGITSHTLHSFSNYWIQIYLDDLGMSDYSIIREGNVSSFLTSAVLKIKKDNPNMAINPRIDRVQTLYDLVWGLNLTYENMDEKNELIAEAIESSGLSILQLREVFRIYDETKKFFKRYDFTDMLSTMDRLLSRPDVRSRMHALYTCIVVDEVQDFTPLMMSILKKLVGPKTRLLAIGDEDQSIYGFRGADVENAVRFSEHFPESKSFQLMVNRRCGDKILDAADRVIQMNQNRFYKQLTAERKGGTVSLLPYLSIEDQMQKFVKELKECQSEGKNSSVACVREKVYGMPATFALFRAQISFYTLNASRFDYHEAFRGVIEVMNLLCNPSRDNWRNLYKVVNLKRDEWFQYIGYDEKKQKVTGFLDKQSLWELDFKPFIHYSGLSTVLQRLHQISKNINTYDCSEYFEYILSLFKQYYWLTRTAMEAVAFSEDVFCWLSDIFARDAPYPSLFRSYTSKMGMISSDQKSKVGIAIATMHALKGLEFQYVYMLFMEESIFPAYQSIDLKCYSATIKESLKEAENRLAYVAMTRAIEKLTILYNAQDPSIYVEVIQSMGTFRMPEFGQQKMIFSNKKVW